jgi:hypothetical protein
MELIERVEAEKIPVDLEYYFNSEITGQMARFIAFHEQFDTVDTSELKDTLSEKEIYDKVELAMFNNAKKYIATLAQQYSNPYQNKGRLFKQTHKIVTESIRLLNRKTKKRTPIYDSSVLLATKILDGCVADQSLGNMREKVEQYIRSTYNLNAQLTNLDVDELFGYIQENKLFPLLKDCSEEWIAKVVAHVRKAYDYDSICTQNLDIDSPYDLFTPEDLKRIVNDPSVYVGLTEEHATCILDIIDQISTDCELHDPNTELGRDFAITCESD